MNDVVLAMFELLKTFPRLMYVDVDVHHGDAVEEAFALSSSVLTLSFHKHGPLFFPGSGALDHQVPPLSSLPSFPRSAPRITATASVGAVLKRGAQSGVEGRRSVVNVPLLDGCGDATFIPLCQHTIAAAAAAASPDALVLQCGADGLCGDPVGCSSLLPPPFLPALSLLRALLPLLLLGRSARGGGRACCSRCWKVRSVG